MVEKSNGHRQPIEPDNKRVRQPEQQGDQITPAKAFKLGASMLDPNGAYHEIPDHLLEAIFKHKS